MSSRDESVVCLFDVDGTLTKPRGKVTKEVEESLAKLREKCLIGLVSGSDINKIEEQMGGTLNGHYTIVQNFDFVFNENGLTAYFKGARLPSQNIQSHLGEEKVQKFINFCLRYLSELWLPCKRGTFIEFRTGLINVCPVGRSCSQAERDAFEQFDIANNVRGKLVEALQKEFPDFGMKFSIGGQISIDCFPIGWDKSYCVDQVLAKGIKTIHFFGDKTMPGGNDHEIFIDPRVIGHTVVSPDDTVRQLRELFSI